MILAFLISSVLAFNVEVWDVEVKETEREKYILKNFLKYFTKSNNTDSNFIISVIKILEFHGGHAIFLFSWGFAISSWTHLDVLWT